MLAYPAFQRPIFFSWDSSHTVRSTLLPRPKIPLWHPTLHLSKYSPPSFIDFFAGSGRVTQEAKDACVPVWFKASPRYSSYFWDGVT